MTPNASASNNDRSRIVALFTLAGAAFGVLYAMLFSARDVGGYGQTDIEKSVPFTFVSAVVGFAIGTSLATRSWRGKWAIAIGIVLLTGLLGGAMGWIVGNAATGGLRARATADVSPERAVATGSVVGLLVGSMLVATRWFMRPRN